MSLKEYNHKRNFERTAEPKGKVKKDARRRFVIQKHDASRLHYDFRLEIGRTLKSWACPKGLPYKRGEKRLAIEVEDHPVAYADFEGTIPKGQYGGGTVMVWDRGTFEPLTPLKGLKEGKLHFILHGEKVDGEWYLVRMKGNENQWLIIKGGESIKPVSKKADDQSVISGKTMKQLSKSDQVWESQKKSPAKGSKVSKTKVKKATRLPAFVEPMKAKLAAEAPSGDWLYEIKFDGWRALGLKCGRRARLLSRNKKDFGAKFPEIVEALEELNVHEAIIDGEIVALDKKGRSSFQLLQAYDLGEERPPIIFYAFDLLQLNGENLKHLPIEERKSKLQNLLKHYKGVIRYSDALGDNAKALIPKAKRLGVEGLIGKKVGSHYEVGKRSGAWIKLKFLKEQEFVIGGFTDPGGARKFFGAIIIGYYKGQQLVYAGKVGTGFNEKLLRTLHKQFQKIIQSKCPFVDLPLSTAGRWGTGITKSEMKFCHWLKPKMVCQIKFNEWTRDGRLRQAVFLGLREDKSAKEVVREKAT